MKKSLLRSPFIIIVGFFLGGFGLAYSINTISEGFKTSTTIVEIQPHGYCKQLSHTGSTSYFVPTNTLQEWQSFIENKPADVNAPGCPLRNNRYTTDDCIDAGGEFVTVGRGVRLCRFNASSCPSGWAKYGNWTTTIGGRHDCRTVTTGNMSNGICAREGSSLTTGHSWSNTPRESATYSELSEGSGEASTCGERRRDTTCYSRITQIGCY